MHIIIKRKLTRIFESPKFGYFTEIFWNSIKMISKNTTVRAENFVYKNLTTNYITLLISTGGWPKLESLPKCWADLIVNYKTGKIAKFKTLKSNSNFW